MKCEEGFSGYEKKESKNNFFLLDMNSFLLSEGHNWLFS